MSLSLQVFRVGNLIRDCICCRFEFIAALRASVNAKALGLLIETLGKASEAFMDIMIGNWNSDNLKVLW